jgi:integrase
MPACATPPRRVRVLVFSVAAAVLLAACGTSTPSGHAAPPRVRCPRHPPGTRRPHRPTTPARARRPANGTSAAARGTRPRECDARRVHPHALRHTYAAELVAANVPVTVIRQLLGHAHLSTTIRYIDHLTNGQAISVLKATKLPEVSNG